MLPEANGCRLRHSNHPRVMMHRPVVSLVVSAVLAAASRPSIAQVPALRVDHHTHIWSLGAFAHNDARIPLPSIPLPGVFDSLLGERTRIWNDANALANLYTEDAIRMDANEYNWIRGRKAVADYVATGYSRQYRVEPIAFQQGGSVAYITGYFVRGEGATLRRFGLVALSFVRENDGQWRVSSESVNFGPPAPRAAEVDDLIANLDDASIGRAVVLSVAYWYGNPSQPRLPDEYARVRAENDWVAMQVARYPDRLVAFCSFNPLRDYALAELDRCAKDSRFRGVKLHLGNSYVDLLNPAHADALRRVFEAANQRRVPIIIHLFTDESYGRAHSQILLTKILPVAPDIAVQIAHMAGGGGGPGYDAQTDEVLEPFASAIASGDPAARNLYFDMATNVTSATAPEMREKLASRIRQIGVSRILFGHDARGQARDEWKQFLRLPLTPAEFRAIALNVAPYLPASWR